MTRPLSSINITPLIDVMLVLLIIFMVVTPLATRGMDAALPRPAQAADSTEPPPVVVLSIEADGFRINQTPYGSLDDVRQRLADIFATRGDKTLFVRSAPDVSYGRVVTALDTAREAGVSRLGLIGHDRAPTLRP
jgi:biopolymer transport protein TolR